MSRHARLAGGLLLAAPLLYLAWRGLASPLPPPPPDCELLRPATVAASEAPPPTLAEFDRNLALLEERLAGAPSLRQEAANRRLQRFQALRDLADLEAAQAHNDALLAAQPADRTAVARGAALALAQHDFRAALTAARAAESAALEYDALNELGEARAARERLAALPARGLGPLLRHAAAADARGDGEAAATHFDAAIQYARNNSLHPLSLAGLLAHRATLALHAGEPAAACAGYAEALALHPGQVTALEWLSRWAWHRGEVELTRALIGRAVALDPHSHGFAQLQAQYAQAAGDAAAAAAAQARAAALRERFPNWYRLEAAQELAAAGEAAAARELLAAEAQRRQGAEYWTAVLNVERALGALDKAAAALQRLQQHTVLHPPLALAAWRLARAEGDSAAAERLGLAAAEGRIELDPADWAELAAWIESPPDR